MKGKCFPSKMNSCYGWSMEPLHCFAGNQNLSQNPQLQTFQRQIATWQFKGFCSIWNSILQVSCTYFSSSLESISLLLWGSLPPPPMYPGHTLAFLTIYSLWNPYHEPEVPNPIFASELKNQVQKGSFHTTQGRQEWNAWPSLFLCNPSPRWTLLILEPGCGKSSQEKLRFWRKRDRWEKSCHCFIHSFVFISSDLCPAFPLFKEAMPEPSNDQRNTIPKQQTQCKTLQIWKTINQEDKNVKACSKSSVSKSLRK